ncbi:MAG: hypothetical protein ACM3NQ_08465 [Bacteroidales bacterium]
MTTGAPPDDRDRQQRGRHSKTDVPAPTPDKPRDTAPERILNPDFEHALRLQMAVITGE